METYVILKVLPTEKKGKLIIVKKLSRKGEKAQKPIHVFGNLPMLYKGMFISLAMDCNNTLLDYRVYTDNKQNKKILEQENVNIEKYQELLGKHQLMKFHGCLWEDCMDDMEHLYNKLPFKDADSIHKEFFNKSTDPCRLNAITDKVVALGRQRRKIAYSIEEYLSMFDAIEQEGAYQQIMTALKIMCLQARKYGVKNGFVYDNELKVKEEFNEENIKNRMSTAYSLLSRTEIWEYIDSIKDKTFLAQEQLDVLWCLVSSEPCILTGGAGTGKTSVIKSIIDCYSKYYTQSKILLIAPTGKASRRLAEKTGMAACTIHRALRKNPEDESCFYNKQIKLPHRLVIIDESSMVDTELMYDLLCAMEDNCKVIFVGDHNQLEPVGYGEPFFRFMDMVKVYRLTINHRQEEKTDILNVAQSVLDGKGLHEGEGVHIEHISYMDIGKYLVEDENTQILSPYNELNAAINEVMKVGEDDFSVGDKVILIRNTKEYCNGDIGYITSISDELGIIVMVDGREVTVKKKDIDDLRLAYSITVHKMQGSECDKVIVFLPESGCMIDDRMIYTAITRARKQLEVYIYSEE